MKNRCCFNQSGFTLIELLIATVISGIIVASLFAYFNSSVKMYNVQEQIDDMNQNAHYTIQRLFEDFSQAGADLPVGCDNVVEVVDKSSIKIWVNQLGGIQKVFSSTSNDDFIPVDNPENFRNAKSIVREYLVGKNITYQVKQIESVDIAQKKIFLKQNISTDVNDYIYGMNVVHYFIDNNNLCLNTSDNILAENIKDLSVIFKDATGNATSKWSEMQVCSLTVTASTAVPDPKYKSESDGLRKLLLTKVFSLKNTFYY